MGKLKNSLVVIAGKNAIGFDNDDVLKLSRAMNYIETQVRIMLNDASDKEEKDMFISAFANICDCTADILEK